MMNLGPGTRVLFVYLPSIYLSIYSLLAVPLPVGCYVRAGPFSSSLAPLRIPVEAPPEITPYHLLLCLDNSSDFSQLPSSLWRRVLHSEPLLYASPEIDLHRPGPRSRRHQARPGAFRGTMVRKEMNEWV